LVAQYQVLLKRQQALVSFPPQGCPVSLSSFGSIWHPALYSAKSIIISESIGFI